MTVDDAVKRNSKILVILMLLISLLTPLFSSQVTQEPIYFTDKDIDTFTNVIQQDSLIYALGGDWQNLYFYCFDQELHQKLKRKVSDGDYNTALIPFKQGFLIKNVNYEDSKLLEIDKAGNIINSLVVDGKIEECYVDKNELLLFIRRNKQYLLAKVNKKFELHSEMELSGFSELTYGITYRIRRTKEYNYVFLCTQTASIYVFDRNWNPIKKVILADNESYIDYQLKIWNDQIILDPLQASWLFYPEYYVDYTGYIPAADQVLFFDLKGNLLKTTDIPRQKKCTSEMIYEENLFIQQPGYNDTLYVVSTDGNIKQEVDLDFSFHKKDHILLSSDKILFAGAYSQCREWQRRGLLLISEHPQESLTLFPMNKDALTLSSAFNTGNTEMLSELMERWYTADIQPKTEFDHIWEKEAYALYEMIFPGIYSFSRTNHQYSNGTPFYNPEYHLIPHNISIEVSDSLFLNDTGKTTSYLFWRYLPTDIKYEITDFRPELTLDLKIIYSTDEISAALSSYLSLSQKDHFEQQRRKFLKDYLTIPILDGTIGVIPIIYGYYDYSHIVFDRDYRKAIITSNYKGRYSCFKELGVWKTLRE